MTRTYAAARSEREERVASVLARATALSDELRSTIRELETILRRGEEESESGQ